MSLVSVYLISINILLYLPKASTDLGWFDLAEGSQRVVDLAGVRHAEPDDPELHDRMVSDGTGSPGDGVVSCARDQLS